MALAAQRRDCTLSRAEREEVDALDRLGWLVPVDPVPDRELLPEQRLLLEVLRHSIRTLFGASNLRDVAQELCWVFYADDESPVEPAFSFEQVCAYLSLEPTWIRSRLRTLLAERKRMFTATQCMNVLAAERYNLAVRRLALQTGAVVPCGKGFRYDR